MIAIHYNRMKLLDLFTGTGSVAKVARDLGFDVTTLDIDPKCHPDICADINVFDYRSFQPGTFDIIWASPPCETFSCARKCNIGREVNGEMCTRALARNAALRASFAAAFSTLANAVSAAAVSSSVTRA